MFLGTPPEDGKSLGHMQLPCCIAGIAGPRGPVVMCTGELGVGMCTLQNPTPRSQRCTWFTPAYKIPPGMAEVRISIIPVVCISSQMK